jgi:hypothetical protein
MGVEKNVNLYLKDLENWLNRWRLKMATHKCAAMIIEPNNSNQKFNFKLYNENIPLVEEQIFLGIKIDRHMKFDKHVDLICAKANSRINIIRILAHKSWKLKKSTLVNVYKTVLRSDLIGR